MPRFSGYAIRLAVFDEWKRSVEEISSPCGPRQCRGECMDCNELRRYLAIQPPAASQQNSRTMDSLVQSSALYHNMDGLSIGNPVGVHFKLVGETDRPRLRKSLKATLRASLPHLSSQLMHEVPVPRLPKSQVHSMVTGLCRCYGHWTRRMRMLALFLNPGTHR